MSEPSFPVPSPSPVATPGDLDHLYWHTDTPVRAIAAALALPARGLHRMVAPLAAGVSCRWCHAALAFTSRSGRSEPRLTCSSCGATRINPLDRRALPPRRPLMVGGLIVVRAAGSGARWDPGFDIDRCVGALAAAGTRWDEEALVVLAPSDDDGGDVEAAITDRTPGVLAVPDIGVLAATQAERLQTLFRLTSGGWRVVSADSWFGTPSREYRQRHLAALGDIADPSDPWRTNADRWMDATADDDARRSSTRHGWCDGWDDAWM